MHTNSYTKRKNEQERARKKKEEKDRRIKREVLSERMREMYTNRTRKRHEKGTDEERIKIGERIIIIIFFFFRIVKSSCARPTLGYFTHSRTHTHILMRIHSTANGWQFFSTIAPITFLVLCISFRVNGGA